MTVWFPRYWCMGCGARFVLEADALETNLTPEIILSAMSAGEGPFKQLRTHHDCGLHKAQEAGKALGAGGPGLYSSNFEPYWGEAKFCGMKKKVPT